MPSSKKKAASPRRTRSKSPARTKKSSSSRSRSRSRSRGRSKSPARTRTTKERSPSPAPKRAVRRSVKETQPPKEEKKPAPEEKPSPFRTPSRSLLTPTRKSARLDLKAQSEPAVPKRSPQKQCFRVLEGRCEQCCFYVKPLVTLFFVFALPKLVMIINESCNKNSCSLRKLYLHKTWPEIRAYYDLKSFLIVGAFMTLQAFLCLVPTGPFVDGGISFNGKKLRYNANGFFALFTNLMVFFGLVYFQAPIYYAYENLSKLLCATVVITLFLAIMVSIKGRRVKRVPINPDSNGRIMSDFMFGRELSPRIGSLDLKLVFIRICLFGLLFFNCLFLAQSCKENKGLPNMTLAVWSALEFVMITDFAFFESTLLTSWDVTHYGFGYFSMFFSNVYMVFLGSLPARFLLQHPSIQLPTSALAAIIIFFMCGYFIYRGSTSQKDAFIRNPFSPALSHLESLPAPAGMRLLVSGWSGLCRYPSLFGRLIMISAMSLLIGFDYCLPLTLPLVEIILCFIQVCEKHHHNKKIYGVAWDRYCQRVKYRIIPYIY